MVSFSSPLPCQDVVYTCTLNMVVLSFRTPEEKVTVGLGTLSKLFESLGDFMQNCMFGVLYMGLIPNHIAFIMDGNCRYAKKLNLKEGEGHRVGFSALMLLLKYCYEMG
ncbi:hypothetical protein HHK36_000456 [Tetracentron sinense]|uniref:Uncharacterized protein n=1 Tax=Tetracentron sinense TaxID=13715 RepID=A0A835A117_TETSI|nr:hypothetical protein HHK36_000456 [Tetracentron sinense]